MFEMDKLSQQELVRIRRGAEDAIQAMNRNHRSFIEAVSHPLNIIALVDMAQASIGQQAKVEELQKQLNEYIFVAETLDEMYVKEVQKSDELQKRVDKAIRFLVEAELYQSEPNIDLAVKALKGEG